MANGLFKSSIGGGTGSGALSSARSQTPFALKTASLFMSQQEQVEEQRKLLEEQRKEQEQEEEKNRGGFFGGIGYAFEKIGLGLLSAVEGIWDYTAGGLAKLFGADDWAEEQFANDWVNYDHADDWFNPSEGWKIVGDITQGIGTSLPSIAALAAVGFATGGAAVPAMITTFLTAGLSAAGNATKEAYRQTGELGGKEFGYGALVGATEGAVETFSDAVLGGIGGQITKAFRKDLAASAVRQTLGKTIAKSFLSEGFEEVISEFADPYWKRLTYDPTAQNASLQELAYAGFVGGMSGALMSGFGGAVSSVRSIFNGTQAVSNGRVSDIIEDAQNISEYEERNNTGYEAFGEVKRTLSELQTSLTKTNGNVETVRQRLLLGRLERANTAAVFQPLISRSAENIYANAEQVAQRMTEYGYTDANGKPIVVTAEQLRAGVDTTSKRSFRKSMARALRENSALHTLSVLDATGQLMLDAQKFKNSMLRGEKLASQVDFNRFIEQSSETERTAVAEMLGIEDWNTLTADDFQQKVSQFLYGDGAEQYQAEKADIQRFQTIDPATEQTLPESVSLEDGAVARYNLGEDHFAVERNGDNYRLYDYVSGRITKNFTLDQMNALLSEMRTNEAQRTSAQAGEAQPAQNANAEQNAPQGAQEGSQEAAEGQAAAREAMNEEAQAIDAYARENIKDYNRLGAANQSMIRRIIRQGRAIGISEEDILSYARVSAHTGVNIVFDKGRCAVAKEGTGEIVYSDGYYDADSNQIVVNPESKRTAESLLIHELSHTLFKTKGGKALLNLALKNMSVEDQKEIVARYRAAGRTNPVELLDEISAHYAEGILSSEKMLDRLLADKPNARKSFLAFFKRAKTEYSADEQLSREAERLYKQYKKWFDKFSAANTLSNARENTEVRRTARRGNSPQAAAEGARMALPKDIIEYSDEERASIERDPHFVVANSLSDAIEFFIRAARGEQGDKITMFVGKFSTQTAAKVKKATGISVFNKSIALNRSELRHIANNHGVANPTESKRGQIPITAENFVQVIEAIASPDSVTAETNEKSGTTSIVFTKSNGGETIAVTILSEKKKTLTLKSAWIINKKRSTSLTPDAEAPRSTSETGQRIKTTSDNSIARNSEMSTDSSRKNGNRRYALDMSNRQGKTSAATSINSSKLPAVFSRVQFKRGTINLDIGGGKFDNATEFLATQGVKNYIYDPYNRSEAHNRAAARATENGQSDTVTISNVLNVIDTLEGRQQVLANAVDALKPDGTAYITVYEGNGSGEARTTGADQFQLNRKLRDYLPEVRQYFDDVSVKNGVIIARSPIKATSQRDGGRRYALAGERSATADSSLLARAREMQTEGYDSEEIRQETGWFIGLDGKWRYEIDDSAMKPVESAQFDRHTSDLGDYRTARLGDVIQHDKLFEAYPQLKDVTLIVQEMGVRNNGTAFTKDNQIVLNENLFRRPSEEYQRFEESKKAEIEQIEQTREFKNYNRFYEDASLQERLTADEWLEQEKEAQDKFFSSDLGKRYHELMWGKSPAQKTKFGWTDRAKTALIHEIQHFIQSYEGFSGGTSDTYWADRLNKQYRSAYESARDSFLEVLPKLPTEARNAVKDLQERMFDDRYSFNDIYKDSEKIADLIGNEKHEQLWREYIWAYGGLYNFQHGAGNEAYNRYWNTAGEVEARDVESRIGLSAEERKAKRPDIDGRQVYFAEEGNGNSRRFALPETQESRRIKPIAGQMDIFRDIIGAQTDTQQRAWDSDYSKRASTNAENIIKLLKERGYENAVSGAENGSGRGFGSDGRNGKGSRVYDFGAIRRVFEGQGTRTKEESRLYSKIVKELGGYSLKSPTITRTYQIGVIDEAFYTYDMLRIADVNAKNGVGTVFYLEQEFYKRGKRQANMLGCYIVGGNNVYISTLISNMNGSRIPFETKRVSPWSGKTTYEFEVLQAWGEGARYAATRDQDESIRNVMRHERLHLMYNAAAQNPSKFGEKANAAAIELKRFVESRFAGRVDDLHRAVKDYYVKELGYGKVETAIEEIACDLYSGSLVLNENTDAAEIQRLVDAIDNSLTDITGQDGVRYALPSTDSEGRELSEQQRKFFADSKVRDEDGNLLVVHHGTHGGEFTVFEHGKTWKNDAGWLGEGFYFYGDEHEAQQYAMGSGRVIHAYLDVRNPYYAKAKDMERLSELDDEEESRKFTERLIKKGYDGVYFNGDLRQEWVVFNANQIKLTTNKNPTSDNDIRYALSENGGSRRPFSRGQRAKFAANNTRFKVYTRAEAERIINSIIDERLVFGEKYGSMSGKSKAQVIDTLFQKLNSTPKGYRIGVALDIADYIIENSYLTDMYAEEMRDMEMSEAMGTLSVLRGYMHRMDLRGIKGEIQNRFDRKNTINLVWGAKEGGLGPDQVAQELENYGIFLESTNEADQFFEMLDMYERARDTVNTRAEKVKLSTYGSAERIETLRQQIARDILAAYDEKGSPSKYAKLVEQYTKQIEDLKREVREAGRRNKLTNSIIDTAQYLRDIASKRKYVGADVFSAPELTSWLKNLGKMKYRSDLRKAGARQILLDYGKFYNVNNPLLYDADPNLSYIDENVLDALALIKENEASTKPLSTEELQAAQVIMLSAKHLFDNYDQIIMEGRKVSITEIATQGNEILKRSKNHAGRGLFNTIYGVMNKIIEPRAVIRSLENYDPDGVLTRAYKAITDGETAAGLRYIELMSNFDEFFSRRKRYKKRLSSQRITVAGAELTVGQAISLYELSKRPQARDGLFEAGFSYMDQRGAKKSVQITESDIQTLEKQFTAEDREFISITEEFFNEQSKKLKTDADLQILGYTNASDEFYFPITRDSGTIAKNITDARSIMADWANVYNFSFNKDVRKGAKNKLFITGVYDVITRHAKQLSTYAELTVPLKNFSQIYSKNIGTKTHAVSIRNTLNEQVWGRTDDYLSKLFKDIQGTVTSNSVIERLRGAYAKYQLGANLKVIVSQITSYPTAGIYLDVASMTRGAVMRTNWSAMDQYCAYARVRNYERGIVRAEGVVDKVGKVGDVLTKPIQWTDRFTIGKLWNACQVQIERNGGAKVGTQENMEKAGALLEDVIRLTQPNYTNTERSELMRSDSDIVRSFTMFTSVPLKQLSRLVEAVGEYRALRQRIKAGNANAEMQAQYKTAKKRLRRTLASITIANLMYCLVGQFFKWLYDKDRKDKDGNEIGFLQDFFTDFVSTSIGMFPIVKDIYNYFANDYEFNNFAYETVNSILSASKELFDLATKAVGGEPTETSDYMKAMRNSLYAIGQLTGLPFRNINNTVSGLIKRFDPSAAYKYNSMFYNAKYSSDIKAALEKGDTKLAGAIMELLLNERGAGGLSESVRAKMISLYEKGYDVLPRTIGDTVSYNGEERTLSAKERAVINKAHDAASKEVNQMVASRAFSNLSEEAQAKAIKSIYNAHYEEALASIFNQNVSNKLALIAKAVGIVKAAPVIAAVSEMSSDVQDGKVLQGSRKAKIINYLRAQSLTDAERLLLLYYLGYKIGNGEYKNMSSRTVQRTLAQYITRQKLTRTEREMLAEMCGLTIRNGRIVIGK